MRNVAIAASLFALAIFMCLMRPLFAQTVFERQDTCLPNSVGTCTGGTKLATTLCNANAGAGTWSGWVQVPTQRAIAWDIDFVDANSDETSLDIRCQTSRSSGTANGSGRDLPVDISTAATGITTMTRSTWRWVATGGGAPGTSATTVVIDRIPGPFINCLFTCIGAAAAADTVTAFARGITP